jgi:hypothetical protein
MFGFSAERPIFARLLSHLGPPPPPPRRHFSKSWDYDAQHGAVARLGRLGLGAGNHASRAGDVLTAALGRPDAAEGNSPSEA